MSDLPLLDELLLDAVLDPPDFPPLLLDLPDFPPLLRLLPDLELELDEQRSRLPRRFLRPYPYVSSYESDEEEEDDDALCLRDLDEAAPDLPDLDDEPPDLPDFDLLILEDLLDGQLTSDESLLRRNDLVLEKSKS